MRKLLCTALVAVLLVFYCQAALAQNDIIEIIDASSGLIYSADKIVGISEGITDIVIPSEINGTKITAIADEAFLDNKSLVTVSVQEGILEIGSLAFGGCENLQSVILPQSVNKIGMGAFNNCSSLITVNIPDGITEIPQSCFYGCKSLAVLNLPESIWCVNTMAFYECSNLRSMVLPEGVQVLGETAFFGCSALQSIHIPKTLLNIGEYAFSSCTALKEIIVDSENPSYKSDGTAIFSSDGTKLLQYATGSAISQYNIPEGVETIYEYAFSETAFLNKVIIPDSVSIIGEGAFFACYNLTSVIFSGKTEIINSRAFADDYMLKTVLFYQNPDVLGENIFENDLGVTIYSKQPEFWQGYSLLCEKLITVNTNRQEVIFDVPPVIENDRTLVPMRAIFEALGAQIFWDDTTKTVTAIKDDVTILLTIGQNQMFKNGVLIPLDTPAKIEDSRTLVPVRAISESLKCQVLWNGEERIITITG